MTRQRSIYSKNITVTNKWWITILLFSGRLLLHDTISGRAFRVSLSPSSSSSLSIQSLHLVAGSKFSSNIFPKIKSAPVRLFSSSSSSPSSSSSSKYSAASTDQNNNTRDQSSVMATGYLNAVDAAALDVELMSTPGFSLEQLMELAGLAVAECVFLCIPSISTTKKRKILIVCGPGNNGGDGLVAARHLYFFRHYDCVIVYPKRSKKNHFLNLVKQCEDVDIPILDEMPTDINSYGAIVDAMFGFSFHGEPREPFASILHQLIAMQQQQQQQLDQSDDQKKKDVQIISVDVPSGWNVDEGDMAGLGFVPDILISLTAPKLCSKQFTGRHYIGGRFLPPKVAKKYNIQMPPYEGVSQVMEVTRQDIEGESKKTNLAEDSWKEEYDAYMVEKYKKLDTPDTPTPAAMTEKNNDDDGNIGSSEKTSWEEQYAEHCAEKESRLAKEDTKYKEAVRKEHERYE